MPENGWVCEKCGEITTGDNCGHCMAPRPTLISGTNEPGSYLGVIHGSKSLGTAPTWCGWILLLIIVGPIVIISVRACGHQFPFDDSPRETRAR